MKRLLSLFLGAILLLPSICSAQLTSLMNSNQSLTIELSGAAATTNPIYNVALSTVSGPINAIGATNGATPVTIATGPTTSRQVPDTVTALTIYNADTAAVTVTLKKVVSGTGYTLFKQSIPTTATLMWNERSGITVSTTTAVANIGAAAGTGVTAAETGNGVIQKTVLSLSATPIAMVDATVQGGGTKIYDFPEGRILVLGVTASVAPTTTSTIASTINSGVVGVWSLGTVAANTDAALTSTEADLIPSTAWTSSTTINVAAATVTSALAASAQFNGTSTPIDAILNFCVTTGTDIDADGTLGITGTVTITWVFLGDY